MERWKLRLRLMAYDFKIMYPPGKGNIADPLSRLCLSIPDSGPSVDKESEPCPQKEVLYQRKMIWNCMNSFSGYPVPLIGGQKH